LTDTPDLRQLLAALPVRHLPQHLIVKTACFHGTAYLSKALRLKPRNTRLLGVFLIVVSGYIPPNILLFAQQASATFAIHFKRL
jgi:hypothetical protein